MKLFITTDIEGVAGVSHWDQIMPGRPDYALGQRLLMGELTALCEAAGEAGAAEIVINDSHGPMRNIVPDQLPAGTRLITGHFKPMYMMEGLDGSFDAAVFLAYHGPAGSASVLSHTYNPRVIWEARINGTVTGETGINALVAHHYGVPVVMITGDQRTIEDGGHWIPEAHGVVVKRSLGRFAADSVSPAQSCALIAGGIRHTLANIPPAPPPRSTSLELTFQSEEMTTLAAWAGAEPIADRRVRIEAESGLVAYQKFHTILLLARTVADT